MIHNKSSKADPRTNLLRSAATHRATLLACMVDEAQKAGIDTSFVGKTVYRCGAFRGTTEFPKTDNLQVFADAFATEDAARCFDMDVVQNNGILLDMHYHYCPLVAAWQAMGIPEAELPALCDIAMAGERGILSAYEDFEFNHGKTIAAGDDICEIRIRKK